MGYRVVLRFDNVKGNALDIASGKGTTLLELARIGQFIAEISEAKELWDCAPEVCIEDGVENTVRWQKKAPERRQALVLSRDKVGFAYPRGAWLVDPLPAGTTETI